MRTYRVAVTGGRDHQITDEETDRLYEIMHDRRDWPSVEPVLIHGNCRGVDQRAAELVEGWGFPAVPFEAPWQKIYDLLLRFVPFDLAAKIKLIAGPLRNWMMLKAADLLVAFPGGKGTADCVRQARAMGVEVVEIGG